MKLHDTLWLWGQEADGHWLPDNLFKLPAHSRMTPVEGAVYFDIPNMCRVRINGLPKPPFDQDSVVLDVCDKVIWSLLGANGEEITENGDMYEVIRQAQMHDNIVGGVFDDFFFPERLQQYTPTKLAEMKRLLNEQVGRPMDMWVVSYEHNLVDGAVDNLEGYLNSFDTITYWSWKASALPIAEDNINKISRLAPNKRILAGCYLWDYGDGKPMSIENMQYQTDLYLRLLKEGKIDGIIVCSNCVADIGLEASTWMRQWIHEHKDDIVR